jgi:beta-lactamase regulating signal transducer with metallopeptidase domain
MPATLSSPGEPEPAVCLPLPSWQTVLLTTWLAGTILCWTTAGLRLVRFGRTLRHLRPAPDALRADVQRLARRLGLTRCPEVLLVPAPVPPLLWAVAGAPRVLLPAALWNELTEEERETLLVHELAHLRRGDHWVRWLELIALGLYWWHPVAWWARRQLQEAEEQCCDAWVVRALPGAAGAYAAALVHTVRFLSQARVALPAGASGIGQVYRLKRRMAMIFQGTTPTRLSLVGRAAVLGLAVVLLPLLPGRGQTEPPLTEPAQAPAALPVAARPQAATPAAEPPAAAPHRVPAANAQAAADYYRALTVGVEQPESREAAQDEVELLQAQLGAKRAEIPEVAAQLKQAQRRLTRLEEQGKRGIASVDDVEQAQTEVAVLEARLRGKEALVREAEVRLKQATRRLTRLPHPAGSTAVPLQPPALAAGDAQDFAGSPKTPRPVTVAPATTTPAPAGFFRTEPAPVGAARTGQADGERRLQDLEKKLDALLREVEALRQEMRSHRPAGEGKKSPSSSLPPGPGSLRSAEPTSPPAGR